MSFACRSCSTTRASSPAGGGRSKPEDLDGLAGMGLADLFAAIVVESAHLAGRVTGDDRVADVQRAALDEHGRHRAAADVETGLDDGPGGIGLRVRAQVELGVGDEEDALEEVLEPGLLLRGHLGELRRAAPVLGLQPLGRELGLDPVDVRVGDVDLVDRDDDRHLGGARVADRLLRLGHHAVVCRDDQHRDVGDLGAAGAHRRERLVARRVEEGELPSVDLGLVGADVLRDPAGLCLHDSRRADRVEQRRLAVVDVAHDRHDRRARREVCLDVLDDLLLLVVGGVLDRHLALDLGGDQLDLLVRERLRGSPHLAEAHQDLDDLRHLHAERGGQVLDGDAGLDRDGPGRLRGRLRARGRLLGAVARGARVAAACRAALDHDAPASAPLAAAARANRTVWSVRAVSHQTVQCRCARAQGRRSRRHAAPA